MSGRDDLVTIDDSGKIYVHPGKANRTFDSPIATGLKRPPVMNDAGDYEPVAVADVNGDGYGDLVGLNGTNLETVLGQADGTFSSAVTSGWTIDSAFTDGTGSYALDVADVSGDGLSDLVVVDTEAEVCVHPGSASGKFTHSETCPVGFPAATVNPIFDDGAGEEPVGLGDVSGDGRADLLTLDGTTLKLRVAQEALPGLPVFAFPVTAYASSVDSSLLDGSGQELVGLFDYSRDGLADLVSVNDQGDVRSYTAKTDATFAAPITSAGEITSSRLNVGGEQFAAEKPLLRRVRCSASGCRPPTMAATKPASSIGKIAATLSGSIIPFDRPTTYQFEYGTTTAYGTKVPLSPKSVGSGSEAVSVSEVIEGLKSGTTYHYRVLATNSEGTTYGEDMTFTTWGSWALQSTPNTVPGTPEARFENISCASSTSCMAVGDIKQSSTTPWKARYLAVWNGSTWESKLGNIDGNSGYGVSCVGTTCRTVGRSGGILWSDVWTESGGKWSLTKSHLLLPPSGATDPKLGDISCTSSSACTAVGSYVKEGKTMTLAQRWNGSAWSIQTTPNPESGNAELLGVSCEAASSCTAVGKQGSSSYAMRWNGSSWSATSTPSPAGAAASDLQNVSCTSSSFCMAAGSFNESGKNKKTLALKWNGSSWSIATTPNPATNYGATLLGISCTSSSACTAVGRYVSASVSPFDSESMATEEKTLALSWGGSEWAIQSSPNPEGKKFSLLRGVSCSAAAACTAVGNAETSEGQAASLGERWNGSSWALQSTPNTVPGTPEARFENISCASSTSCMAVGDIKQSSTTPWKARYLAVWNGSTWESKLGTIDGNSGYGVSCVGTTCRTVGRSGGILWSDVWTESGGKWSLTKSHLLLPPSGATDPKLGDISCTSSSACTAVGSYVKEGKTMTLAQRWNGSAWSIQTTPNPESGNAELLGVSCEAASSCTAVGKQGSSSYAMRWNGSSWSATSTPSPAGAAASDLQNVSCTSSSFCMAAGSFNESGKNKKTLALKWNGSSWSIATTPNPATNYGATLLGISCTSSSACTAVGRYVSASVSPFDSESMATEEKTLALSWGGSEWAIQSSPNPEGKKFSLLRGVSCSAAAACTAVGNAETSEGQAASLGERYE